MTLPVNVTYTLPVYRKLAQGDLEISKSPLNSHMYLDTRLSNTFNVSLNYNSSYIPVIYNVIRKPKKLTITTNTLNILVTNITINSTPLYQTIDLVGKTAEEIVNIAALVKKQVGDVEVLQNETNIYFNLDKEYLVDGLKYIPILKTFDITNSTLVKKERLKDRIKLTITHTSDTYFYVKLNCTSIFQPVIKNERWIEIPECVIILPTGKPLHIYNHSYRTIVKKEVHPVNSSLDLKDPVLANTAITTSDLDKYSKLVSYSSYRSNLLLNVNLNSDFKVYFKNPLPLNFTSSPFIYTTNSIIPEDADPLFSVIKSFDPSTVFLKTNPYHAKTIYGNKGEDIQFLFKDIKEKYSHSQDISLGKNLIKMNPLDISANKAIYVAHTDGSMILQQNILFNNWEDLETYQTDMTAKTYSKLQNISEQIDRISAVSANHPDNIKGYTSIAAQDGPIISFEEDPSDSGTITTSNYNNLLHVKIETPGGTMKGDRWYFTSTQPIIGKSDGYVTNDQLINGINLIIATTNNITLVVTARLDTKDSIGTTTTVVKTIEG